MTSPCLPPFSLVALGRLSPKNSQTFFFPFSSTLKPGVPPPLPPKPRLNSSSEELGLNDERSLTVRRFPNSENGPSQAVRRQSTPDHGNKGEQQPPDFLSVSVSSPGLLSHSSDPGELAGSSLAPPSRCQSVRVKTARLFHSCKLSVNPNVKVRKRDESGGCATSHCSCTASFSRDLTVRRRSFLTQITTRTTL